MAFTAWDHILEIIWKWLFFVLHCINFLNTDYDLSKDPVTSIPIHGLHPQEQELEWYELNLFPELIVDFWLFDSSTYAYSDKEVSNWVLKGKTDQWDRNIPDGYNSAFLAHWTGWIMIWRVLFPELGGISQVCHSHSSAILS